MGPLRICMPIRAEYDNRSTLEDLEAIKCKNFTQGLRGPALRWFHNLPSGTVNSYQDLILRFKTNFAISVRTAKVDTDLMLIHQQFDEPLERFINKFSEEYVSIPKCTDLVATKALMQGLLHGTELKKAIIVEPGLSLTRALTMARGYVALEAEEKRHAEEVSWETSAWEIRSYSNQKTERQMYDLTIGPRTAQPTKETPEGQ
ncbi:hypothetical protein F8388_011095 [Cannabis sativa]|uniref:Retrotransposon gag domain-containing protein n=1 Tax=Cannabis sativa TaxID=3483 RepID=A0A7J6F3C4_CANSA|nr:hypothetical protein F8388_011095 [Cannabis sativa]KAF4388612.1 hypothetical protein G4B88_021523 [Cannabis sativa]